MVPEVFLNYSDITKTDFIYSFVIVSLNQLFAKWHKDKTLLTLNRVVIFLSFQLFTWLKKIWFRISAKTNRSDSPFSITFAPSIFLMQSTVLSLLFCLTLWEIVFLSRMQSRTPRSDKLGKIPCFSITFLFPIF